MTQQAAMLSATTLCLCYGAAAAVEFYEHRLATAYTYAAVAAWFYVFCQYAAGHP